MICLQVAVVLYVLHKQILPYILHKRCHEGARVVFTGADFNVPHRNIEKEMGRDEEDCRDHLLRKFNKQKRRLRLL